MKRSRRRRVAPRMQRPGAVLCIGVGVMGVLYGIYLVIPPFRF